MNNFDLYLRRILYLCAVVALLSVAICAPYVAWKAGAAIDSVNAAAVEAKTLISEAKQATGRFNDPARVKRVDDYLISQSAAALATTNNSRKIANNLNEAIKQDLRPLLQDLRPRLNAQIEELTATTATLNRQIEANGQRTQKILDRSYDFIAGSEQEVFETLKALRISGQNLSVITDDQHLQKTIEELNATGANVTKTTANAASITTDIAGVSDKYLSPLYKPQPPKGFFGKIGGALKYGIRLLSGAGNLLVIVDRLQ